MAKKSKAAPKRKATLYFNRPSLKLSTSSSATFLDRVQKDLQNNQAIVSIVLGILIILVLGFSIFNFIKKSNSNLLPAQQTVNQTAQTNNQTPDVTKENLPGKYTVKSGDTLFTIAQKYYNDGYQYSQLVKANSITNENVIEVGQVLNIPKPEVTNSQPSTQSTQFVQGGTGGSTNQTEWGTKIAPGSNYTVQSGDWLSKIAGRAYGDIYQFNKIAQANNIPDPNNIEPGTVIKIPQ